MRNKDQSKSSVVNVHKSILVTGDELTEMLKKTLTWDTWSIYLEPHIGRDFEILISLLISKHTFTPELCARMRWNMDAAVRSYQTFFKVEYKSNEITISTCYTGKYNFPPDDVRSVIYGLEVIVKNYISDKKINTPL